MLHEPPEGYELLPAEDDEPQTPESTRFRAPDGEVVTLADLVEAGVVTLD